MFLSLSVSTAALPWNPSLHLDFNWNLDAWVTPPRPSVLVLTGKAATLPASDPGHHSLGRRGCASGHTPWLREWNETLGAAHHTQGLAGAAFHGSPSPQIILLGASPPLFPPIFLSHTLSQVFLPR